MAGKALAAFFLLVTLLQVRADVDCYSGAACPVGDPNKYVASTARECCLAGLPDQTRGYSSVDDPSDCKECIVIGFSHDNLTLDEGTQEMGTVRLRPLTSGSEQVQVSTVRITIQVVSSGTNPILGSDLTINGGNPTSLIYSSVLSLLNQPLTFQALADDETGEFDNFRLEVTNLQLTNDETGETFEPFFAAPLIVIINDDDIIEVEFEVTEYRASEKAKQKNITFTIREPIPVDTHFIVHAMTYKQYDDMYPELKGKYPNIKPYAINDEYDQAELEDFQSRDVHFTILANEITPDGNVTIFFNDDDLLEPLEEGFRLLLEVDTDEGTRQSEVRFGARQIAVFRIDNDDDKLVFGFTNPTAFTTDMVGVHSINLPLAMTGRTEIPMTLTFSAGDNTTAQLNVDFRDFSASVVNIQPYASEPEGVIEVTINGDDIFEPTEYIEVAMGYTLHLPDPFQPVHTDESSPLRSIVDPPPKDYLDDRLRSTVVIIEEGIKEITAELSIPKVVQEGDSFLPLLTVSYKVNATFRVFAPALFGTAERNLDYTFMAESVTFDPTSTMHTTSAPVNILTDNLVEPSEEFNVTFYLLSSPSDIADFTKISNPNQTVTIIDQNSATIGFETLTDSVDEDDGSALFNVTVQGAYQLASNAQAVVRFYTSSGTAQSGTDFVAVDKLLTFNGTHQRIEVAIPIVNDAMYEQDETFQAHLEFVSSNANIAVDQTPATVTIIDDDPLLVKYCTLSRSLILHTFSNEEQMGEDFNISMGCERKLVTSCDPNVDLEIRVDFFKDNFDSTKVAIFYEGEEVIMDESLNLTPATSPSDDLQFSADTLSASVSIPDIGLTVTLNRTQLTISTDNDTLDLAGLCGNITGELVYPDCTDIFVNGDSKDEFIHSFKVKPSDQVLRGERKECGITANDTVISDPLMTVPIHAPGFPSDLNLCYEIHGTEDKYFNLVSDECTSVNAHYARAAPGSGLNIIDSISVVAVDNTGKCHNITVNASDGVNGANNPNGVDGTAQRRRRSSTSELEQNGVSVRSYDSRVRISVPNCEDNELVMWVVCQTQSLYDQDRNTTIEDVEMIKFEIARGLNLKETSHGLLGQFWNIPISVTPYNGPFVYKLDPTDVDKYYTVEVHYPMSAVRSFVGYMFDVTWEWKHKSCVYAGDRQGGPAGEVASDGSVIQGTYSDYVIATRYGTQFKYGVFEEDRCM